MLSNCKHRLSYHSRRTSNRHSTMKIKEQKQSQHQQNRSGVDPLRLWVMKSLHWLKRYSYWPTNQTNTHTHTNMWYVDVRASCDHQRSYSIRLVVVIATAVSLSNKQQERTNKGENDKINKINITNTDSRKSEVKRNRTCLICVYMCKWLTWRSLHRETRSERNWLRLESRHANKPSTIQNANKNI